MLSSHFTKSYAAIRLFLGSYFRSKQPIFHAVDKRWGRGAAADIYNFALQGKMVRGGLVLLGFQTFRASRVSANATRVAAAMELMHSALLMHDDIMDRDTRRRGSLTVHEQYARLGSRERLSDPAQFGLSAGICLGDVGFFLAQEILQAVTVPRPLLSRLHRLFINEVVKVGLAQLREMYQTLSPRKVTRAQVISIYRHKTARYTYSLPLMMGAMLAGATNREVAAIERLGETLGLVFQIHDDELGVFGHEEETGKNVGSDIREKKKTLIYQKIFSTGTFQHQAALRAIFSKSVISRSDVRRAQALILKSGIYRSIERQKNVLSQRASDAIARLSVRPQVRQLYCELLEYNSSRTR